MCRLASQSGQGAALRECRVRQPSLQAQPAEEVQATQRQLKTAVTRKAEAYPSVSGMAGHPRQALPLLIDVILRDGA